MRWRNRIGIALLRALREVQRRRALAGSVSANGLPSRDVTLARIIGNDLWPRHAQGQALQNLAVILRDEPDYPGCRKLFVLNRMFDAQTEAEATQMVLARGHALVTLPFVPADYAALSCDTKDFGDDSYFAGPDFAALSESSRSQQRLWACADKVRYVMNVNGARNAALDWGRAQGGWTLVLDGSCFVAPEAWERLRRDIAGPAALRYLIVPMQRLASNAEALTARPVPNLTEEPQIAFHPAAAGRFDEVYPYGLRDKVALLTAIGVPGAWDHWGDLPWLPKPAARLPDRHCYAHASTSVFRLTSGVGGGRLEQRGAQKRRYQSRNAAIFRTLAMLDDRYAVPDRDRARQIMGLPDTITEEASD